MRCSCPTAGADCSASAFLLAQMVLLASVSAANSAGKRGIEFPIMALL
jgi:hypothetical protein